MEDIEYLDEYKDLVMPGIKSGAPPASAGVSRHRRISSDSSNSSSIDADIFQKLFHGKYLNDEVLNAPSGSKSQDRRRRSPSPSSSSSDESNDALEALFNPRSSKSKPIKRRERYESFDSVDDLGEALMRPMQKSTVHKSKTSQAGGKKLHAQPSHRSKSSSSSHLDQSQVKKPQTISSTKTEKSSLSAEYRSQSAKNRNRNSTPTKSTGSLNGSSLSSAKNKTVTIIKAQRADVTASKQEPKTDPLTLQNLYDDSDSDSSYEYESDFYGDYDSDEEDEPVIDISTDTSRTTSVADTVTPVVSDDEGQDLQSEQNERSDNNQESILSGAYERLQSYLSNLSCAEAPPIYKKQNSARKSRSNEKKPSSSEQVKHANERPVASDKEETDKKERLLEPPEASSSAKSSASKASVNRKLYAVDANVTLESVERMSHDLAEQIMEIDVEFEKRSGSKTRSGSKSKISADSGSPSLLSKSHVRKLTYSSEQLDDSEPSGTMLRRSKSESFPKQERSRGEKQRKSRAATTDEKTLTAPEGQGETPKKKRGRPRKIIPNKETLKVETTEKPTESLDKDISQLIEASGMETAKETIISKEPIEHDELNADLDKAKDFAGFDNLSQDDNKINSSPQETDIKSAPDRGLQLDEESIRNLEKGQLSIPATSVDTLDTAHDHRESESATNLNELVDTTLITQKDDTKKDSATESIENIIKATEDVELPGTADANAKTMEVSENILEQSDSQLAEDIKLAEEILAAEVGKGIEVNEVVASVEGEQDPVTEIVKELVQETISQVAVIPNEQEQPDENSPVVELNVADKLVENHDEPFPVGEPNLADEPVEKQTVDDAAHPPENEPHADEQKSYIELTPVEDQHSIVEEETTAAKDEQSDEQNQAQAKEEPLPSYEILPSVDTPTKNRIYEEDPAPDGKLLQSSQDPPSIVSPAKKQNHSSPANTPKKSRELEALGSSVPRRSLRSDKATPQNQRSSRSRRSLRTELTQLLDESSRRSSPRLGKSPAESHSSQERSPVEKKVITSKLAKEKIASENGMVVEEKSHPPESATNVLNDIKTTEHIGDADPPNISAENLSAAEIKKESLGTLKSKKSRRSRGSRRKKPTSELHEELATTIKCAEEFSTCSESEQKNEERGDLLNSPIAEPPVSNSNSAVEQSVAKVSDTEQSEEKPLSPRKTRRMVKERDTSESETPSDYLQAKSDDNPSTTHSMESVVHSETQGCNTVAVIEERTPGRLSRRDKAIIDAGKSQKVERPSAKSQSAGRKRTSKEKPSNQSHNKVPNKAIEPIITDNDKEEDKSKSEEKSSDSSSESNPEKISSEVITKQSMQDQENADSDSILKESAEDLAKVSTMVDDKKPIDKVAESNKEQCLNTEKDKPASSDEPESGPISIELSIDSAEPKESEVKSKVRSKKEEKNPKESESENDKGSGVKTKTASSSSMASVEKTMVTPEVSKGKTIGIGSGRIRKRRQAVPIEDPEDTFGNTTLTENETPAVSCFSDKDSDPFSPFIKIPSKTYIMSKRIKTPSSPSSEALENVPKTSDLELTLEGKSEIKKELLTSIPSTSEISESLSSNEVKELSSPTQNTNESSTTSIAPIKRHQRTKKSYGARSKSSKSKTRKSNNTFENSTNIASESSTSTNQKEPSSPTVSCRKLRVLIKRTPTLDWTKNTKKTSSLNKNSAKSKRLNKIIESIEPSEQCDNNPETALVETSPGLNTDPESFPEPDLGHETNKILNEVVPKEISENLAANTNNEQKNKLETDQDELVEDVETSAEGENPIPNNSPVLEEPNKDEFKSITNATHEGDISEGESPELQVPNEESVKLLHPIKETPSDHKSSEESASLAKTSEDEDIVENELSTVASALTEPETDVTDDEEPAQSPIPDSTETTSVMDEPEATTSSVVKRSLRKREVDSSQPDEAAKRKQRQDKKSVTDKKEFTRPARRHHLPEEEERPVHKRSKLDSESRTKFISIIGKETIMSSTTAPVRETRSETTSTYASARKSAAKESKRSEINKPMLLGQSAKKLLRSNSPIPFTKKPMVQTLLSSTLSLHKPASGEDGSSVATRKSLNKADREENKASDQPILSSSIVVTKKSLPSSKNLESLKEDVSTAVPRKVNISVSVVPLKETSADTSMAPDSTPETSPILQRKAQKASRKSETNRIVETKKKAISVGNVNQFIKSEESEEITETSPSSAVIGRKILPQLESQIKTETMASEGASLAQRSLPQTDFSNKPESRKSETVKNIRTDYSEEMGKVARGRETSKKRTSAQRRSKHKSGLLSSEVETTSDSRDSSREDRTSANRFDKHDNPASVSLNKSVKKTRSSSSNRSLTFTPIPISGEQQNDSKDRFTPILDQNRPAKHTPSLGQSLKGRGRGGPPRPVSLKRKAEEGADHSDVANLKRSREREEDLRCQDVPDQDGALKAFPVKIIAARLDSSVDPEPVSSAAKPADHKTKIRKLRVKINRRSFNKWLRATCESKSPVTKASSLKLPSPSPQKATSETESAAESESTFKPQEEPVETLKTVPPYQPDSCPSPAPEFPVRKSSTQHSPKTAHVPSAAPAFLPASMKAQTITQPANATAKTAIYPLTEQHLPDEATLLENAKKLADQRRVQTSQAKLMPLPVPIPEVKAEPEDTPPEVAQEDQITIPLPVIPQTPIPSHSLPMMEDVSPSNNQVNNLGVFNSTVPTATLSIPSASAPGGNPNAIGQTKLYSFLYPKRYKPSYDDVGLDFCCPNLDGPMRAIDFTRLHSTAEVPVLEVPQYLVITTKFISKADKNIPSRVRAKLEMLSKYKEQELLSKGSTLASGPTPFPTPAPTSAHTPDIGGLGPPGAYDLNTGSSSIPTTVGLFNTTSDVPSNSSFAAASTSQSSPNLDSLSNQLPRGITLARKLLPTESYSMLDSLPPTLIQLPPICPEDKQRMELQARVQVFDLALQVLSRRVATLTLAQRQRTIEEIVRSSSLMAIDVDVGSKLLENYVHYIDEVTSSTTPSSPTQIDAMTAKLLSDAANPSSSVAATSSSLSRNILSTTTPSSSAPHHGTKKTVQQRSSLPASIPLFDEDKNIIGFRCNTSKARTPLPTLGQKDSPSDSTTPMRASTSAAAAALAKTQPRSSKGSRKSTVESPSQIVNLKTTVSLNMPAKSKKNQTAFGTIKSINPPVSVQKPMISRKKTAPVRTFNKSNTIGPLSAQATFGQLPPEPEESKISFMSEDLAAEYVTPAGLSHSSTSNPNMFIMNQASEPEECILPDSNSDMTPMEAEIKGELDDSSEAII